MTKGLKETLKDKVKEIEKTIANDDNKSVSPTSNENIVPFDNNSSEISVVPEIAITLNEARQRIYMLQSFVKEMMIPNIDYGIIQGCKKPSLYKSGAEKLCDIFGFSKHFEITNRIEDWDKQIFHYEVKAVLVNKKTALVEAEGLGSCCNKENKYANQKAFNIINTILKMAKKRAFIDAVLSATRSSGIFTQDIEDIYSKNDKPPAENINYYSYANETMVGRDKTREIMKFIKSAKLDMDYAKKLMQQRYNVSESRQLTVMQADDFIEYLKNYKAE